MKRLSYILWLDTKTPVLQRPHWLNEMGRAGHNWLVIRALVRNQFCEHVFVEIAEDFISLLVASRPVDACIIQYEIEWDGAI